MSFSSLNFFLSPPFVLVCYFPCADFFLHYNTTEREWSDSPDCCYCIGRGERKENNFACLVCFPLMPQKYIFISLFSPSLRCHLGWWRQGWARGAPIQTTEELCEIYEDAGWWWFQDKNTTLGPSRGGNWKSRQYSTYFGNRMWQRWLQLPKVCENQPKFQWKWHQGLKFFSEHQNIFARRSFKASPIEAQQDVAGNLNNQRITVVGCVAFANLHIINVLSLHKRTTNFRLFHNFSPHFD